MKYVYSFDEDSKNKKELLGEVGYKLSKMNSHGLPILDGFTITTEAVKNSLNNSEVIDEVISQVFEKITELENKTGKCFGKVDNPLLLSLNLDQTKQNEIITIGLNDEIVERLFNSNIDTMFVYDLYNKQISRFTEIKKGNYETNSFDNNINSERLEYRPRRDDRIQYLKGLLNQTKTKYRDTFYSDFPQNPKQQLMEIIKAIFCIPKFKENINGKLSINIQEEIVPMLGGKSIRGEVLTRNTFTGKNELCFIFNEIDSYFYSKEKGYYNKNSLINAKILLMEKYEELFNYSKYIEKYYRDILRIEFVIANDKLFIKRIKESDKTIQAATKLAEDIRDEELQLKKQQQMAMKEIESILFNFEDVPNKEHILVKLQRTYEFIKQISILDGLYKSKRKTYKSKIKRKQI